MNPKHYELLKAVNSGVDIREMKLRVVDYARVSTAGYAQKKSFENQLETYRRMIEENPTWVYAGTYSDEAVSGTKAALRGGFQQMITDAEKGCFDLVLVKDVARFARNIKECLIYKDKLKSCGVMIYFVKENINSFRNCDEMMLQFMALGAEMEAKSARSRTKIVFEQGIQNGKIYGNSKILGYQKQNCKLIIDPNESKIVKLIFELYVYENMGLRKIAKELVQRNLFRKDGSPIPVRTIKSVLENPKYKGFFCGRKTEVLDMGERCLRKELPAEEWVTYRDKSVPAIVSEELWDKAEQIRKRKRSQQNSASAVADFKGNYRYSGKIESELAPGVHYTHYFYCYKGEKREGWQCRSHKDPLYTKLISPTVYSDEIDPIVNSLICTILGSYEQEVEALIHLYQDAAETVDSRKLISGLKTACWTEEKKLQKLLDLYQEDILSKNEYILQREKHQQKIYQLKAQIQLESEMKKSGLNVQSDHFRELLLCAAKDITPSRENINLIINKIIVCKESTKQSILLRFNLNCLHDTSVFQILRNKK